MEMEEGYVEAIEGGKIVRVSEGYARQEGLLILRRKESLFGKESVPELDKEEKVAREFQSTSGRGEISFDEFRRPLRGGDDSVKENLIDNFHWEFLKARRDKGLTRKRVIEDLGIDEKELKMIENGVLMRDDMSLINRLQEYYGVNVMRSGVGGGSGDVFEQEMRKLVEEQQVEKLAGLEEKEKRAESGFYGDDIEIIE